MQAVTEMVPEMFIKGCCMGRERTQDTQEHRKLLPLSVPLGASVVEPGENCVQRPCDRLLLDASGHLCLGSEAGMGWNDLSPTLV